MITIAEYLVTRLDELGIKAVFGLPGDFNFRILDAVVASENVEWVNCTNELNAGYAADGYARQKGFGAVVTTFGVGELSAVNAIAGANAENIPIVKIVGTPNTKMIENNVLLHHNFSSPDYYAFEKVYSNVVESTAFLNKENAKSEIDRVLNVMLKTRKPVYIAIPVDVCGVLVEEKHEKFSYKSDLSELEKVIEKIKSLYLKSEKPILLFDYLVKRFNLSEDLKLLSEKLEIPVSSLLMGKGAFDETSEFFIGIDLGNISSQSTQQTFKNSDFVLSIGTLWSDLNTAGFSAMPNEFYKVEILADRTIIEGVVYNNVLIKDVIRKLIEVLPSKKYKFERDFGYKNIKELSTESLKVDEIFPIMQDFLKENDIFIAETGIIATPSGNLKLPKGTSFLSQTLWGSIGWATPAAFGVAMADKNKRTILFTGEGSHQLTVQEIANMFTYDLKPIVVVLNNKGYTIERLLSKEYDDPYNSITKWDYSKVPELFSGDKEYFYAQVKTQKELKIVLQKAEKEQKEKLCYIEVFTNEKDFPTSVNTMIGNIKKYFKSKK